MESAAASASSDAGRLCEGIAVMILFLSLYLPGHPLFNFLWLQVAAGFSDRRS